MAPLRLVRVVVCAVAWFALSGVRVQAAVAQNSPAVIAAPVAGASAADFTQPIRWSAVSGAEAYYLYVGTSVGAKNLIDTGQTLQTSYPANSLPLKQLVYARLWTKLNGAWKYTDSTFTGATGSAVITYPVKGSSTADLTLPISWAPVNIALSYYLYVGSTPGAKDLIDSGEIKTTSYPSTKVPENRVVYARLWTKLSDGWRYTDSSFRGEKLVARMTSPANGSANADWSTPIVWTGVPRAEAYYLYVGSTPGAKDFVNSGEMQQTSYKVLGLPADRELFARLWTRVDGAWRYVDSTFSGSLLTSEITYPPNGAQNADLSRDIEWTVVANAESYYLYVGTSPGGKDLIDSSELHGRSRYTPKNLPSGQTLYARIWSKAGGVWRFTDSTFTGAPVTSRLTYPEPGTLIGDPALPIRWTDVPSVQAYYLYIGTTPGGRDLVDSGETQQTAFLPRAPLPPGQTLYARMWAKTAGVWRYTDSTFAMLPTASVLAYPPNAAGRIDKSRPARWTAVPGVQAYYLFIGTAPGAADLVNTGETLDTSRSIDGLPVGPTLYATLWTKVGGVWRYSQTYFSAGPLAPEFTYPQNGATNVDVSQPFSWRPPASAQEHWLYVGTAPGANDLVDSGELTSTSFTPSDLTTDRRTLYARVWSRVNNTWARYTDIAFSPRARARGAFMIAPRLNVPTFDTSQPFRWSAVSIAQAYRLTIGSTSGASDLHDSGEVRVTRRFVPGLPVGVRLFGRIATKIDGVWSSSDFTFTVGADSYSTTERIASALWATDFVRGMADSGNRPYSWSALLGAIEPRYNALCSDYANMLVRILGEVNVGLPARRVDVSFNGTNLDAHSLVELQNPETGRWMLLDPTFNLAAKREDGTWAGPDDVSQATRAFNWTAITYVFLGSALDTYARGYYLDYALLFVNVYHADTAYTPGVGGAIAPFLTPVDAPFAGPRQALAVRCTGSTSTAVVIDGVLTEVVCNAVDSFSPTFYASSVAAPAKTTRPFTLYRVPRFVF